ncbi:MAG: hypothetical protein RL172_2260 [Bacteroidota bacterium]|jgi:hypothetical protein
MPVKFGKPISIVDANIMFKTLQDIKNRSRQKIEAALADDPEALAYYTSPEVAFAFSKAEMTRLVNILNNLDDDAAGLLFYNGIRTDKKGVQSPTIMSFAYNTFIGSEEGAAEKIAVITAADKQEIEYSATKQAFIEAQSQKIITSLQKDGGEHPGGGGGGTGTGAVQADYIPLSFNTLQVSMPE